MTTKSKSKSVKSGPKKRSQKKSQVADFGRKTVRDEVVLSVKDLQRLWKSIKLPDLQVN